MKKILALLLSIVFLASFLTVSQAQETKDPFEEQYKEYSIAFENYQAAHTEYISAKAQYEKTKTLTAQQNLLEAGRAMLQARDEVLVQYLQALREKFIAPAGIEDSVANEYRIQIDSFIDWHTSHEEKLNSANDLGTLQADTNDAKKMFTQMKIFAYKALSALSMGKIYDYKSRTSDLNEQLSQKALEIKNDAREEYKFSEAKNATIERWLGESENRIIRAEEKYSQADDTMLLFEEKKDEEKVLGYYNSIIFMLGDAQQYLKESASFMKEIIREIKTEERKTK